MVICLLLHRGYGRDILLLSRQNKVNVFKLNAPMWSDPTLGITYLGKKYLKYFIADLSVGQKLLSCQYVLKHILVYSGLKHLRLLRFFVFFSDENISWNENSNSNPTNIIPL